MNEFKIKFTGHEKTARKLLREKKLKTANELAEMTSFEVEDAINKSFSAIECGEDWLLVPKEKMQEFNKLITWIER